MLLSLCSTNIYQLYGFEFVQFHDLWILNPRSQAREETISHHGFLWWWRIKAENGPVRLQLHFHPTWTLRVCDLSHILNFLFSPFILSTAFYFLLGSRLFFRNWGTISTLCASNKEMIQAGWAGGFLRNSCSPPRLYHQLKGWRVGYCRIPKKFFNFFRE